MNTIVRKWLTRSQIGNVSTLTCGPPLLPISASDQVSGARPQSSAYAMVVSSAFAA